MLEQISVIFPAARWEESRRGRLSATVAREFPSIFVGFDHDVSEAPHLAASEWDAPHFDSWRFDCAVDALAASPFTLRLADDGGRDEFPLEVLNRCQRAIGRRNHHSHGQLFDRILRRHRQLHDPEKPLVRADYDHALDVWQWVLRLDGEASLALQLAALFHDIERLATEADERIEHLAADYTGFKTEHARTGAEMAAEVLAGAGVPAAVCERVAELVRSHEQPSADRDVSLLNDADALSFFSLNSRGYADYFGPDQTRRKVAYTSQRLSESARAKLSTVALRADVKRMLEETKGT